MKTLTVTDIQNAADTFRPVFDRMKGADGFVSLEVSPFLANDTEGSIRQARHLWSLVDRPNVMIKIPATKEGIPAIQKCLEEGININITLLFGIPRYREVVEAYLAAMEKRAAEGKSLNGIASVASFFLSRIDVLVDPQLEKIMNGGGDKAGLAASLIGRNSDCQRQDGLQDIQGNIRLGAISQAQGKRRADPAGPVGQHQHEKPRLQRREIR